MQYAVFIGYDYDNDKGSKDQLLGCDANKEIQFSPTISLYPSLSVVMSPRT